MYRPIQIAALVIAMISLGTLTSCAGRPPLSNAAHDGDVEAVIKLIDSGAPIDETSKNGMTPLMYSITGRELKTFKIFLQRGASV